MSSSLPTDEALEKEGRIYEMKKKKKKKKKYIYIAHPSCTCCKQAGPTPLLVLLVILSCNKISLYKKQAGPYPTVCQSSRTPRHWKLPSTIARPNHPQLSLLPFFFVCYRRRLFIRSNLISSRWIWLEFKLIQYFMPVLVTCKFDDDPIKNTGAIVSKVKR